MVWVWDYSEMYWDFDAQFDFKASRPSDSSLPLGGKPFPPDSLTVFKSKSGLKRFSQDHCIPCSWTAPVVDQNWRDIILDVVPQGDVQFVPVELRARGEVSHDFFGVIALNVFPCLDLKKSKITDGMEGKGGYIVWSGGPWVFKEDCLAGAHLVRDFNKSSLLIVSDKLRDALVATGQEYLFKRGEDLG